MVKVNIKLRLNCNVHYLYLDTSGTLAPAAKSIISMKKFFKYFLYYLIAFLFVLYITTIKEGMEVFGIKDYYILKSFEYFIFWVLPYWWFVVLAAAVLFAIATLSIKKFLIRALR